MPAYFFFVFYLVCVCVGVCYQLVKKCKLSTGTSSLHVRDFVFRSSSVLSNFLPFATCHCTVGVSEHVIVFVVFF